MVYILAFSLQRLLCSSLSNCIVAGFILYLQQLVSITYHNQWLSLEAHQLPTTYYFWQLRYVIYLHDLASWLLALKFVDFLEL